MQSIILASQSPRRKELLSMMGLEFQTVVSNFDEQLDDSRSPETVAIELALGKARSVAEQYPNDIVIGADTIVTLNGKQLEKPKDSDDAHHMLKELAGNENDVTTGVAVICRTQGIVLTGSSTTKVFFRPYDKQATDAYVATGDPLDKAGAYGIQSGAAPLISHISGEYDTIIGLPTKLLSELLEQAGVSSVAVSLEPSVKVI